MLLITLVVLEKEKILYSRHKEWRVFFISVELEGTVNVSAINNTRLPDYFCSDTTLNLSIRVF